MASMPPTAPFQLGRYRIIKPLGQGGMGAVYLAHDTELDRQVALKVPNFSTEDSRVRERFYREARLAATLRHPHICPVFDIGECDGVPYLTMAYIEGKSLGAFVRSKSVTQRQAALLVRKVALALQEAHQHGVIHRDLKPANIMIDRRGEPIVMDFGLARRLNRGDARITQTGEGIGTPAYMPPEQISATRDNMGPACDIYSLGVILYEILTGRLPFTGDLLAVLAQIACDAPPSPTSLKPDIAPALEAICLRAMAKKPEERFASMHELAGELEAFLRNKATSSLDTPRRKGVQTQAPGRAISMAGGRGSTGQSSKHQENPPELRTMIRQRAGRRLGMPAWVYAGGGGMALVIFVLLIIRLSQEGDRVAQDPLVPATSEASSRTNVSEPTPAQFRSSSPSLTGRWLGIDPSKTNAWPYDPARQADFRRWENGVLTLENGGLDFDTIRARDISIRAKLRPLEGNMAALTVRNVGVDRGYHVVAGSLPGEDLALKLAVNLADGTWKVLQQATRKDLANEFFEVQLTAVGEGLQVHVNGEEVFDIRDNIKVRAGSPGINAWKSRALLKDIEVMVLDKPEMPASPLPSEVSEHARGKIPTQKEIPPPESAAGIPNNSPPSSEPSRPKILRHETSSWQKSKTNYARYHNQVLEVGMGSESPGWGNANCGAEIENIHRLKLAVTTSGKFRYMDVNSLAGFIVDYRTSGGYTKRVALHTGIFDRNRFATWPHWGKGRVPDEYVAVGNQGVYDLDLQRWAPPSWNGQIWFTVTVNNTGAGTRMVARITDLE